MRLLTGKKSTSLILIAIMAAGSFMMWHILPLYSVEDKTDRVSNGSSHIFSPGYVNVAKYKTESIVNQKDADKGIFVEGVEAIVNTIFGREPKMEPVKNTPMPELKQKSTPSNEPAQATKTAATQKVIKPFPDTIQVGSGESQVYQVQYGTNRLISEVVDGKRYFYVGFGIFGSATGMQNAVNSASAGDTILVGWGTSNGLITIKNGVSIYGSFKTTITRDSSGNVTGYSIAQNITNAPSSLNGRFIATNITKETVIDGFRITSAANTYGLEASNCRNLTVSSNTFLGGYGMSVRTDGSNLSQVSVTDNKFAGKTYGLDVANTTLTASSHINSLNNDYTGTFADWGGVKAAIWVAGENAVVNSKGDYFVAGAGAEGACGGLPSISQAASNPIARTIVKQNIQIIPGSTVSKPSPYQLTLADYGKTDGYYNSQNFLLNTGSGNELGSHALSNIFGALLKDKQAGMLAKEGASTGLERMNIPNDIQMDALSARGAVDLTNPKGAEMEVAAKLADILQNPTQDQKVQIDILESLMKELEQVQKETGSAELKKQESDLLQMVATVLLAQAMPDLLKEGDISNIKAIFSDLGNDKNKIIIDYQEATKPYYEEIKKALLKNLDALHLSNILSKNIIQKDVENLDRNEIDKILDKLRRLSNRSFEEDYILQQEAKYREKYIDPNNKKMESQMKVVLQDFTRKIYLTLNNAHIVKEDKEKGVTIIDLSKKRGM